jgi:hypothetical protein
MISIFFFICSFARAAWFHKPLFLKVDAFNHNNQSMSQIILNILALNHPCRNLHYISTFFMVLVEISKTILQEEKMALSYCNHNASSPQ